MSQFIMGWLKSIGVLFISLTINLVYTILSDRRPCQKQLQHAKLNSFFLPMESGINVKMCFRIHTKFLLPCKIHISFFLFGQSSNPNSFLPSMFQIREEEAESILPAAAFALAKIHMHLVYSGYVSDFLLSRNSPMTLTLYLIFTKYMSLHTRHFYTARGGFSYTEHNILGFHTGQFFFTFPFLIQ